MERETESEGDKERERGRRTRQPGDVRYREEWDREESTGRE